MHSSLHEVLAKATGGEFVLVELTKDGPQPVYDPEGGLLCFRTGKEAEVAAIKLTDQRGNKVQPRRAVDKEWKRREAKRLKDGTYQVLPWHEEAWWGELKHIHEEHYPHVSLEKTAFISFTEDEAKGSADVQTRMKPGRYLERYYSTQLGKHIIRDLCCIFSKKYEDNKLQFAETADDIEDVYLNGPTSCMSKEKEAYNLKVHPVRLYAAGDLQVAYMRREGRIVARSVVWPERKIYNRIYGDKGRLESLLSKAGYEFGAPSGARILKERHKRDGKFQYVCPHIDEVGWVYPEGGHLIVGKGKRKDHGWDVSGGYGVTELLGYKCSECKSDEHAQRQVVLYRTAMSIDDYMCNGCAKGKLVRCTYLGTMIEREQSIEMEGGEFGRVLDLKKGTISKCNGSGKYAFTADMILMPDGTLWSASYFRAQGQRCEDCGGGYNRANDYCPRCRARST